MKIWPRCSKIFSSYFTPLLCVGMLMSRMAKILRICSLHYDFNDSFWDLLHIHWQIQGCHWHSHPQWDPIHLFSHVFSPKSARVRGRHPQWLGALPPTVNPGSATDIYHWVSLSLDSNAPKLLRHQISVHLVNLRMMESLSRFTNRLICLLININ